MAHEVKTQIDLNLSRIDSPGTTFERPEKAFLELITDKGINGIYSSAYVIWKYPGGMTFSIGGDYRTYLKVDRRARATQKALDTQHAEVFTSEAVADHTARAKAYYAAKQEEQAA